MNGRRLQRGVIIVPSALTIANLFFGMWAMVSAANGEFERAAWLIVFAGITDTLDGRVARATKTGSRFGEELDSLVDAISFGVAPGLIIYHLFLVEGDYSWIVAFWYVSACVVRLARFNIEQAGHAKFAYHGLPSPSAGMALATFYPFSQTAFFATYLAHWNWPMFMTTLMVILGFLMMSHVLYPVVPRVSLRNPRGIVNGIFLLTMITLAVTIPALYFFPALLGYVAYGVLKATVLGFMDRLPDRDPMLDEEESDDAGEEKREIDYHAMSPGRLRRRKRRRGRPVEEAGTPPSGEDS